MEPDDFTQGTEQLGKISGLNSSWLEFVVGIKAELFKNLYLGASARLGFLIAPLSKPPENFSNLFIPGFNKVTDGSNFGVGYNYSLSYLIPLYKKTNKPNKKEVLPQEPQRTPKQEISPN